MLSEVKIESRPLPLFSNLRQLLFLNNILYYKNKLMHDSIRINYVREVHSIFYVYLKAFGLILTAFLLTADIATAKQSCDPTELLNSQLKITFRDGTKVNILSREGNVYSYKIIYPDQRESEMSAQDVFTIYAKNPGKTDYYFKWDKNLDTFNLFASDEKFEAIATIRTAGKIYERLKYNITILPSEKLHIDQCFYEVVPIRVLSSYIDQDGNPKGTSEIIRYIEPVSRLGLKVKYINPVKEETVITSIISNAHDSKSKLSGLAIEENSNTLSTKKYDQIKQQRSDYNKGRRLALVVGNDNYHHIPKLRKAVNDSNSVATALKNIGYEVFLVQDADRRVISQKLQEFQSTIQPGDTVFFFFAGHGVAMGADNILLASDVPSLKPGQDDIVRDEGFSVDSIVRRLQNQGAKTLVLVLDACRNNPFAHEGTRSIGSLRGLTRQDAPEGVFVLFSAGLGQEALDRLSNYDPDPNSVFTRKLVPALMTPFISHQELAKRVQKEVSELASTINVKQQPAYYDQIIGDLIINDINDR